MTAGRTLSWAELNNTWGGLSASLHNVAANIEHAKRILDGLSVADLVTLGAPADQVDANIMKSAAFDMGDLAVLFRGGTSVKLTGTYDYRTFAEKLLGTGLY